jgi:hypothetical protein
MVEHAGKLKNSDENQGLLKESFQSYRTFNSKPAYSWSIVIVGDAPGGLASTVAAAKIIVHRIFIKQSKYR